MSTTDPPCEQFSRRWPQFHLRTLMLAVTGCCILFALMKVIGPLASAGLCIFLLLVLSHIAGNAIGTKLRDDSDREVTESPTTPSEVSSNETQRRAVVRSRRQVGAAPSRLQERTPLGRLIVVLTAVGAIVGGSIGSLAYAYWTDAGSIALIVGSISAATLGGFFGFAASCFFTIILRAWRQALHEG
ncbi:MAG TPA: hypothetical protein VKB78_00725 [Pirellulales bacterium]|nr:hypothetical protein [Pirellulales bacterium]